MTKRTQRRDGQDEKNQRTQSRQVPKFAGTCRKIRSETRETRLFLFYGIKRKMASHDLLMIAQFRQFMPTLEDWASNEKIRTLTEFHSISRLFSVTLLD
jgi:hypothetical protein